MPEASVGKSSRRRLMFGVTVILDFLARVASVPRAVASGSSEWPHGNDLSGLTKEGTNNSPAFLIRSLPLAVLTRLSGAPRRELATVSSPDPADRSSIHPARPQLLHQSVGRLIPRECGGGFRRRQMLWSSSERQRLCSCRYQTSSA